MEDRSRLTLAQACAFLGVEPDLELPDEEALLADAERILDVQAVIARETANLAGLELSPIWEIGPRPALRARLAVRAPAVRARALTVELFDALEDEWIDALLVAMPWLAEDPIGAAHALEDTHRFWFDAEAPTRALDVPLMPHLRLLSMALADLGRKRSASFGPLAWLASMGLPLPELRAELGGPFASGSDEEITRAVREKSIAMWAEELRWKSAAFGR